MFWFKPEKVYKRQKDWPFRVESTTGGFASSYDRYYNSGLVYSIEKTNKFSVEGTTQRYGTPEYEKEYKENSNIDVYLAYIYDLVLVINKKTYDYFNLNYNLNDNLIKVK